MAKIGAPLAALPNGLFLVAVLSNLPKIASIRETDMTLAQRGEPHGSNVQMRPLIRSVRGFQYTLSLVCVIRGLSDSTLHAAAAESLPRKAKPVADHTSCPANATAATYVSPPLHDATSRFRPPSPHAPQLLLGCSWRRRGGAAQPAAR